MKKVIIGASILLVLFVIGILAYGWYSSEARPHANPSPEADLLANKMINALNKEAWDTTKVIQWTFMGSRHFLWDKMAKKVQIKWDDNEVLLSTATQSGKAFVGGQEVSGEEAADLAKEAWSAFCNDSFWLNAGVKAFDEGTTRSIVTLDDGREALLVSYSSGGTTPGDAYAWILDQDGMPLSYKMWVSIIPVGGMEVTWEDWTTLSTGAKIAQNHKGAALEIPITNLKGAYNWEGMAIDNPFLK